MHFLCGGVQVDLGEEALVGRQLGGTPILLFKNARVVTFDRIAVRVVLAVPVHRIDEK